MDSVLQSAKVKLYARNGLCLGKRADAATLPRIQVCNFCDENAREATSMKSTGILRRSFGSVVFIGILTGRNPSRESMPGEKKLLILFSRSAT